MIKLLIEIILERHNHPVKRAVILKEVNDWDSLKITDRKFRKIVAEMIEEGVPIGTSQNKGYFLVTNQEEFNDATASLHSKAMSLLRREKMLKLAVENRTGKQIDLPLNQV